MRIIAGTYRGRRLVAPKGLATRPMTDRVRENLFNIIGPTLGGAVVLDLFCGSGALGLEALSRGAAFCRFVDSHPAAIEAVETNCTRLGLDQKTRIVRRDALRPGPWLRPATRASDHVHKGYTLVFVDPPYNLTAEASGRKRLAESQEALVRLGCVAPGALAMVRLARGTLLDPPWPAFELTDRRTYGSTTLWLLEHRTAETKEAL